MANWTRIAPVPSANEALRSFVSPYNPNLIYLLDSTNVRRSDDGGATWQTDSNLEKQLSSNNRVPIVRTAQSDLNDHPIEVALVDMAFDARNPNIRFAIGLAGAFSTKDGVNWTRLLDTGALPCRPMNCYYDWIGTPGGALYVSMSVRGLLKISPLETITLVVVPNVIDSPATLAANEITAAHLVPKFSGANQRGSWVFSQSPAAGHQVLPGSTVTMVLHKGPVP
jgi:PASTA domain